MFDRNTEIVKSGTIVRWAFNNPHSWLYLNVKGEDGKETLWSFEGSAPTGLIQRGITGDTFKPGANVTFMYCPLRDGRPGGAIGWAQLDDGNYLNPADGGCNGSKDEHHALGRSAEAGRHVADARAERSQGSVEKSTARRRGGPTARRAVRSRVFPPTVPGRTAAPACGASASLAARRRS